MKELQLIIKQKYLDEIIAGTKNREYREIRPTTSRKYINYICNGVEYHNPDDVPVEGEVDIVPIKYDAIRFFAGYNKDRDSALVEVKGATIEFLVDENGDDIVYEYNGEEYVAAQIVYDLGKVIEKNV
ncbi:MAG: ASCH domain-containing protein [Paramuribaculum sp.]|nr:ASCH domain-containing protein [Paramuribaculum sp.]